MLYDLTITQFTKTLSNLSHCLDKAAAYAEGRKFSADVLLTSRLAPDQFAFTRQIQIACDTAKNGAGYLTGQQPPAFADEEKSIADLKARIDKTIAYLKTLAAKDFEGASERRVSQPRWQGKWLTGQEYALHHLLPNFFFHVTTAYAILRHNGVQLGKTDFIGSLPLT